MSHEDWLFPHVSQQLMGSTSRLAIITFRVQVIAPPSSKTRAARSEEVVEAQEDQVLPM